MPFAGDCCLSIFERVYQTGALVFPIGARVLEIGCAEADWFTPMMALRPDLQIVGIDWRPCERPGVVIQGDVLTTEFSGATFDAIVGISSLEHVGLGHYDHDPIDPDGDVRCGERIHRWLKPGGWLYADVPYAPEGLTVHGTEYRAYDDTALQRRLIGPLTERGRWFGNWQGDLVDRPIVGDPHLMSYVAIYAVKETR